MTFDDVLVYMTPVFGGLLLIFLLSFLVPPLRRICIDKPAERLAVNPEQVLEGYSKASVRKVAKWIAFILSMIGFVVFIIKFINTSAMALTASSYAQIETTRWLLGATDFAFLCWMFVLIAANADAIVRVARDRVINDLRASLDGATDGERPRIESQLRELGA